MNTTKINPVGLFLMIGFFLITVISYSQESKLSRKEQAEMRRAELIRNYQVLDTLLESKKFILEADFLSDKYGNRIYVSPTLNFIKLDSIKAVLQIGSTSGLGYNGVGGITAEGNLKSWRLVKKPKERSYFLQFSTLTNIGVYDISMTINADNFARATINGLRGGTLVYEGHLETLYNSSTFKGQNTF